MNTNIVSVEEHTHECETLNDLQCCAQLDLKSVHSELDRYQAILAMG